MRHYEQQTVRPHSDMLFAIELDRLEKCTVLGRSSRIRAWCTLSEETDGKGGVHCKDWNIAKAVQDSISPFGALPWAIDPKSAGRFWRLSEQMTGVKEFEPAAF